MAFIGKEKAKYDLPEVPTRKARLTILRDACLGSSSDDFQWGGLIKKPITRKGANQFILGAIMDYQMKANFIWDKAKWIAEEYFKDSETIWEEIGQFSEVDWYSFCKSNSVHRFPAVYKRIRKIGKLIEVEFCGDARKIWEGLPNDKLRTRLMNMGFGPQITNMIMGALFDEGIITGTLDIKADTHATRVLGRAIEGREIPPEEAINIAREIYPDNPWKLDRALYQIGQRLCTKATVSCKSCPIKPGCYFYHDEIVGIGSLLPKNIECVSFNYIRELYAKVGWVDENLLLANNILRKIGAKDDTGFVIMRSYIQSTKSMETLVFYQIGDLSSYFSLNEGEPKEIGISDQGGNEIRIEFMKSETDSLALFKVYSKESLVFTGEASETNVEWLATFVLKALK